MMKSLISRFDFTMVVVQESKYFEDLEDKRILDFIGGS